MVCPGYWAARHSSNLGDIERIFKIAEKLVRRLPPPWERFKQRGIGEVFFGGIENRYGARTRCKLPSTKTASILLMAAAHNLRTLARVRAMKEIGVFIVLWIYSTTPARRKTFKAFFACICGDKVTNISISPFLRHDLRVCL